jgi:hypothetical protein
MAGSLAGRVGRVKSRAPQQALLPGQFDLPDLALPLAMLTRNLSVHYVDRELLLCGKGLKRLLNPVHQHGYPREPTPHQWCPWKAWRPGPGTVQPPPGNICGGGTARRFRRCSC